MIPKLTNIFFIAHCKDITAKENLMELMKSKMGRFIIIKENDRKGDGLRDIFPLILLGLLGNNKNNVVIPEPPRKNFDPTLLALLAQPQQPQTVSSPSSFTLFINNQNNGGTDGDAS